jgi:hypothetical protein
MWRSVDEIKRELAEEFSNIAHRVPPPRDYADVVDVLMDVLKTVFNADHVNLETGLSIEKASRCKCAYKIDPRESYEYEIVEAVGSFYCRADVVKDKRVYRLYAEFKAHFVTVPDRSAHIVLYLAPPHELTVEVDER